MPDKMHLEGGPNIGPPLAESGEERYTPSEHMSGFSEAPANSITQGQAALLRKPAGSCYGIGASSCYAPLLRTIVCCYSPPTTSSSTTTSSSSSKKRIHANVESNIFT